MIPNGILTNNSLTNVSEKNERQLDLKIGVSYQSDLKAVKNILLKILENDPAVLKEPEMNVFVSELGDSAVILGMRGWVRNDEFWPARWRILEKIKLELDENGIEIPYPQMTVHMGREKI